MHTNGAQDLARNGMADQEVVVLEVAHMETDHVDHLVDWTMSEASTIVSLLKHPLFCTMYSWIIE